MQSSEQFRWLVPDLTRIERLLVGLVAFLLLSITILALVVFNNRSQGLANAPAGETQVGGAQSRVIAAAPRPMTARGAYATGLKLAQNWAADAQLWRAEATWTVEAGSENVPSAWVYTFYSPSRGETGLVSASSENVALLRTQIVTSRPSLISIESWEIDSPTAMEILLRGGGRAFLSMHERATVNLTFTTDGQLRWQATLINESGSRAATSQVFRIEFDAIDGELISRPLP